jgi:hypothetical protein
MPYLERRRQFECRLTPDRALTTLEEAEAFLDDRGLLTLMPDSALPSLFGACHEPPYKPGSRGFGLWPATKYPWGVELAERRLRTKLHRGKGLFLSEEVAALADPLCRDELARADEGEHGPEAQRLVRRLAELGPALPEELETDRRTRERLERLGATVSRPVLVEGRYTSELARWDQLRPTLPSGSEPQSALEELLLAGVRAAVVAPEREAAGWFSWRANLAQLVEEGRLVRPEPGVVCLP